MKVSDCSYKIFREFDNSLSELNNMSVGVGAIVSNNSNNNNHNKRSVIHNSMVCGESIELMVE